jgi:hypothetical protein
MRLSACIFMPLSSRLKSWCDPSFFGIWGRARRISETEQGRGSSNLPAGGLNILNDNCHWVSGPGDAQVLHLQAKPRGPADTPRPLNPLRRSLSLPAYLPLRSKVILSA